MRMERNRKYELNVMLGAVEFTMDNTKSLPTSMSRATLLVGLYVNVAKMHKRRYDLVLMALPQRKLGVEAQLLS